MFFSSRLNKFKSLKHCFFSRKNGVSKGFYESLNCGLGSNDNRENILKNLEYVSKKISCQKELLITLDQRHSNKVVYFKNQSSVKNKLFGDAIVTKGKNIGISILSADCVPILFYNHKKKIIGCAHSGWKGALNGIIKNTVEKFNELDSKNEDLIVAVGPCLGIENYEVKEDFLEKFITKDIKNKKFFNKINDKYFFDLRGFVNKEISNLNIKNIENIEKDTFSEKEFFYSYRRSCLNKEKDYGRCISVILMT
jgi:polyphenol oxidase